MENLKKLFSSIPEDILLFQDRINRDDWEDAMLCGKKSIRVHTLRDAEIIDLGSTVLKDIMNSIVSKQTVGAIILLAWNLRNPLDLTLPIFPNQSPCGSPEDLDINTLDTRPFHSTPTRPFSTNDLNFPVSGSPAAASIAYISASLLRLFTKPEQNYLNALPHIKTNFSKFYHFQFPLSWFCPPKASLEAISIHLRHMANPEFKYGMAGMLYLHNEIGVAVELREKLYEEHLSCAGLHAYKLFARVRLALQVPSQTLIKLLDHRMTRRALSTLSEIVTKYDGDEVAENVNRRTWKYARVFDESMFGNLQTKNCRDLVCILAHLSCMAGVEDDQNIFRITELRNVGEYLKEHCRDIAQKIYDAVSAAKIGSFH